MPRTILAALTIMVAGLIGCSDDNGNNAGGPPPDVTGTWTASFYLNDTNTVSFWIVLAGDSTDTINAVDTVKNVPLWGQIAEPVYREYGTWTVAHDSILITRATCESNTSPIPAWTSVACNPGSAKMPIKIAGNAWTVKFADLKPYVPAGLTVPGYADDADVVLVRQ